MIEAIEEKAHVVEPGIYYDLPAEDYFAIEALSSSGAAQILKSPAHYIESRKQIDDETKEKLRGTAAHAAVLQPKDFVYLAGPRGDGRTKAFKDEFKSAAERYPNHIILRGEEYDKVIGVRESVWAHPIARKLLECEGQAEVSFIWRDAGTGVLCKARADKIAATKNAIVDLKCLRDVRPDEFSKCIFNRGYHRQGAVYQHGAAANGIVCDLTAFIAVENEPPHGVIVYELDDEAIERGWADFRVATEIYATCIKNDEWPNYEQKIHKIGLPKWARSYEETF